MGSGKQNRGAARLRGARVVKVPSSVTLLAPGAVGTLADDVEPLPVPIADEAARTVVSTLLVDLGPQPVDAGGPAESRVMQPGTIAAGVAGGPAVPWTAAAYVRVADLERRNALTKERSAVPTAKSTLGSWGGPGRGGRSTRCRRSSPGSPGCCRSPTTSATGSGRVTDRSPRTSRRSR